MLPVPALLTFTIYTFYFVPWYNTATNCMEFSNQVLISTNIHDPSYDPNHADQRLLRFIAIVALSLFCLVHYFSGRIGRVLNQILALIKVILLLVVIVAGIVRASHNFKADWSHSTNPDKSSSAAAFLLVMFSYSGWENATFVSKENLSLISVAKKYLGCWWGQKSPDFEARLCSCNFHCGRTLCGRKLRICEFEIFRLFANYVSSRG